LRLRIAWDMTAVISVPATGVSSPAASSAPPPASDAPAITAFRLPGRMPTDSKN
jgi:hypothetical protein